MKPKLISIAAAVATLTALPAFACSICRCGDPTFNALGKEGIAQTGFRLALDWDQVRKTQGDPADDLDSLRETRTTVLAGYGFSDSFGVFVRLPYSTRDLTETEGGVAEKSHAKGLADPEIYAQARLWSSPFEGDVGTRSSVYVVFGVKTAWGQNNAKSAGERLDEHVQPGTGSTDWFGGLSGSYQVNPSSALFASIQYRHTGENDFDYRYGRVVLLNLAYEHKLGARWDAVIEANYRHAGMDRVDGAGSLDADTGGSMTYVTPRLLFNVGDGWVLRTSAQIPVSQAGLHGEQHEKAVYNVGVTRLIGR
jgi:hypothetical protein